MTQTIVKLEAQNVKRLKTVRIKPDGNLVVVGGNNAQGKSSVLDAITMALGGGKQIPSEPIRKGQNKAYVILQTESLIVTRRFSKKGSTVEVKDASGSKLKSPQTILDDLVSGVSFDPLAFLRFDPKKQLETLRELAGVNLDTIGTERALVYDERAGVNKQADEAQSRLNATTLHEGVPNEAPSAEEILAELKQAAATDLDNGKQRTALDEMRETAVELKDEIKKTEKALEDLRATLDQAVEAGKRQAQKVAILPLVNLEEINDRLDGISEVAEKVRENKEHLKLGLEVERLNDKSDALTEQINAIDQKKHDLIAEAKLPIEGLDFGDDGIMFEGVPFDQASQAQQLRVSVAMGLALNPELRVLLVRDGSLLDEKSLALVAEMAAEAKAQVWLERVSEGEECSVILEDGEVRE